MIDIDSARSFFDQVISQLQEQHGVTLPIGFTFEQDYRPEQNPDIYFTLEDDGSGIGDLDEDLLIYTFFRETWTQDDVDLAVHDILGALDGRT